MEIKINIEKKHFFILLSAVLFLGVAVFVMAYSPSGVGGNPESVILRVDGIHDVITFNSSYVNITKDTRVPNLKIGNSGKITYNSGSNAGCPGANNVALMRKWSARTCSPGGTCGLAGCTTSTQWSGEAPDCTVVCVDSDTNEIINVVECTANSWTQILCME